MSYSILDNSNVIDIDKNTVLAKNVGDCNILSKSVYKSNTIEDITNIKVSDIRYLKDSEKLTPIQSYEDISLCNEINILEIGQEYPLLAYGYPNLTKYDNLVKFESSNLNVCTCYYGVLKGINIGKATITVSLLSDASKSYSFNIEIIAKSKNELQESEIYNVVLPCVTENGVLHTDNTNSEQTTKDLQYLFDYASINKYKKIKFPKGSYLITPNTNSIKIPSNLIIDFNESTINIEESSKTKLGYRMFLFDDGVKNSSIINATISGERYTKTCTDNEANEQCVSVFFGDCYNCRLDNCNIINSPGFNISALKTVTGNNVNFIRTLEEGKLNDLGDKIQNYEGATISTGIYFRSDYFSLNNLLDYYAIGNIQGYGGYIVGNRLYDIYFYDENYNFLSKQSNNRQFFRYNLPDNASYGKICFYLNYTPTNVDADFNAYFHIYSAKEPVKCCISNCEISNNASSGIALCGGIDWVIERNYFHNNGIGREPSTDIDIEDGWESCYNNVIKYNKFENGINGVTMCSGINNVLHNNSFKHTNLGLYARSESWRVYNNTFENCWFNNFACQQDSVFSKNIMYNTNIPEPKTLHDNVNYAVRIFTI